MCGLTMNMNHDPLGDGRGNPILGDAQVRASIRSGQLGQDQRVPLDALLHWIESLVYRKA